MRDKLALTIALTAFAVALGAGLAGASPLVDTSGGSAQVNVPGVTTVQVPLPACADGADNDGDGLVDLGDPDCTSSAGTSEGTGPPPTTTPPPTSTTTTGTTTTGTTTTGSSTGSQTGTGSSNQTLHNAN